MFEPHLTPVQMMEAGVFGGSYFHNATDEDFQGLEPATLKLSLEQMDPFSPMKNFFCVRAGQSFAKWSRSGWIFPEDPLGWFHWYCRFYSGRRHLRDEHQIKRWQRFGPYWARYAERSIAETGGYSAVVKQSMFQWGYSPARLMGR